MAAIPSGTKTFFKQTAAPTNWTKETADTDYTLRVVSGTPQTYVWSSGNFSTVMTDTPVTASVTNVTAAVDDDYADLPAHTHTTSWAYGSSFLSSNFQQYSGGSVVRFFTPAAYPAGPTGTLTGTAGGGGLHSHPLSLGSSTFNSTAIAALSVQYIDFIMATKD